MPRKVVTGLNREIHVFESLHTFLELHKDEWGEKFNGITSDEVMTVLSNELQIKRAKRNGFCTANGIQAYDSEHPRPCGIVASTK